MCEVPVALGYCVGAEQVFLTDVGALSMRKIEAAVDVDPGYVNALRPQVASQGLCKATFGEIPWAKCD